MHMNRRITAIGLALVFGCVVASAAPMRDGGVIRNSGSTNFTGYTIKVWSDGATWTVHSNRVGEQIGTPVTGQIPVTLALTLLHDALQARKNRTSIISRPCMKSASFGTVTSVLYHEWTSPDLECPGGGFVVALGADAHKIAALLKMQGIPGRRIPMLQNEPRRMPAEMHSGQPSPSPEPAAPAS